MNSFERKERMKELEIEFSPLNKICLKDIKTLDRVLWNGKCGHVWESSLSSRLYSKTGCPYCSNNKILIGFNDMWATEPELAKQLANPEDGYKYTRNSNKKLDWKCELCNSIIRQKVVGNILKNGVSCPRCSDKWSYGEKIMFLILKLRNIVFTTEKSFEWSKNKRYDFYIESKNTIIEIHGAQHYRDTGFHNLKGGRSFQKEIQNDILKKNIAFKNKIKNYIIIDTIKHDFNYIYNKIVESNIFDILNILPLSEDEKNQIKEKSMKTIYHTFIELWNKGHSIGEISKATGTTPDTISFVLRKLTKEGVVNCTTTETRSRASKRKIAQLDLQNNLIKIHNSIQEAMIDNNLGNSKGISKCCKKIIERHANFKWMYKEDYEKQILMEE